MGIQTLTSGVVPLIITIVNRNESTLITLDKLAISIINQLAIIVVINNGVSISNNLILTLNIGEYNGTRIVKDRILGRSLNKIVEDNHHVILDLKGDLIRVLHVKLINGLLNGLKIMGKKPISLLYKIRNRK
jgi:hypothetical protein